MLKKATFSPCRNYRYSLYREWSPELIEKTGYSMFIGLNPSTADEVEDDPTIRRCIRYAQSWGYGGLYMANLFAFRATLPLQMKLATDPIGPENDQTLSKLARGAGIVVAAWGVHGVYLGRDAVVTAELPEMHCLRMTKGGHPAHPLYLPRSIIPRFWM